MFFYEGILDRKLVHKQVEENVFVKNLRRAIPSIIPAKVFEDLVVPSLTPENRAFLLAYYLPVGPSAPSQGPEKGPDYVLFNIPHELDVGILDGTSETTFTARERKTLMRHFSLDASAHLYRLHEPLTDMGGQAVAGLLNKKAIHLTDSERIRLSDILEEIPDFHKEEIFFAGLHVHANHPFFFEHPNEHVPGVMLLEAGRQFALACWHVFGKVPLKGMQFIMNTFYADFFDYVDLNYPATFQAEAQQIEWGKNGQWVTATMKLSVFQREEACVEIRTQARVIVKKIFQRMRSGREDTNPLHRFHPIENVHHQVSLWDCCRSTYVKAALWDLSLEGFRVEVFEVIDDTACAGWEVVLYFEEIGFIRSNCSLIWQKSVKETFWAGFRFEDMTTEDRRNLRMVIRQYCHLNVERERL